MDHHYVMGEGKYGITNKLWDYVFNTTEKIQVPTATGKKRI
jgi:sterol desaturase/sphingolipid hydroxylase (fatty acid hydroxylase superfamily)